MSSQTTTEWVRPYGTLLLAVALEPKEIGKRIKRAREARGWTQVQLAQRTSNAPSTIQRWEGGKPPPVRELMRLAEILEIPVERLVEDLPPAEQEDLQAILEELAETKAIVARIAAHLGLDDSQSAEDAP